MSPGRTGSGINPLGFARRVVSIREEAGRLIVETESVGIAGAATLGPEIRGGAAFPLFQNMNYRKTLRGGGTPVEVYIQGSAGLDASVLVNPAFQIGARVPSILHRDAPSFATWVNVDARAQARLALEFDLEAGITSGGASGSELEDQLSANRDLAQDVLGRGRQALFGDAGMKPAGGWRRTFISSPSTQSSSRARCRW